MSNRARRLASRLISTPSYVFGRFESVRRGYALSQILVRPRGGALDVAPLYANQGEPITRGDSGMVVSDRSAAEHRASLAACAWSDGIRLTPDAIATLGAYAHAGPLKFRWGADRFGEAPSLDALDAGQRTGLTTATLEDSWRNPDIRRLAGDTTILAAVEAYLGYPARLVMPYFFWSFAGDIPLAERVARNQTVMFHYDVQGFNFAYVSFYLLDTDRTNGAHALIEGSHRAKKPGHLFGSARIDDAEAEASYGRERIVTIERPAGEGFFEDTSCFHKALPPAQGDRLMLQFRYL